MKAVAMFPGKPMIAHVIDLPRPSADDVPDGRGVLVKVLGSTTPTRRSMRHSLARDGCPRT